MEHFERHFALTLISDLLVRDYRDKKMVVSWLWPPVDSRMRQLSSGIGAHFKNSHFELFDSKIERLPTLLGTYVC